MDALGADTTSTLLTVAMLAFFAVVAVIAGLRGKAERLTDTFIERR